MVSLLLCEKSAIGGVAARIAADTIRAAIASDGAAAIVLATGASQRDVLAALVEAPDIDWARVTAFHLDEYIGLPADHAGSFRRYLHDRFMTPLGHKPRFVAIAGESEVAAEISRLNGLLAQQHIAVCFAGLGANGHLAFNDPPADFATDAPYIRVRLSQSNRGQQWHDGWFPSLDTVPVEAITMSIRQIMKSGQIIVSVSGTHKAQAVRNAVEGQIVPDCPASILQTHARALMLLDTDAAVLLAQRHALKEYHS